nr:MAG TPA: hypothetical protein [Caudoviricetes sp.]
MAIMVLEVLKNDIKQIQDFLIIRRLDRIMLKILNHSRNI